MKKKKPGSQFEKVAQFCRKTGQLSLVAIKLQVTWIGANLLLVLRGRGGATLAVANSRKKWAKMGGEMKNTSNRICNQSHFPFTHPVLRRLPIACENLAQVQVLDISSSLCDGL